MSFSIAVKMCADELMKQASVAPIHHTCCCSPASKMFDSNFTNQQTNIDADDVSSDAAVGASECGISPVDFILDDEYDFSDEVGWATFTDDSELPVGLDIDAIDSDTQSGRFHATNLPFDLGIAGSDEDDRTAFHSVKPRKDDDDNQQGVVDGQEQEKTWNWCDRVATHFRMPLL